MTSLGFMLNVLNSGANILAAGRLVSMNGTKQRLPRRDYGCGRLWARSKTCVETITVPQTHLSDGSPFITGIAWHLVHHVSVIVAALDAK